MIRYLAAATAVLAIGVAGVVSDPGKADAAGPACVLPVILHEDGSYSGVNPTLNGRKIADRWVVNGPAYQGRLTWGEPGNPYVPRSTLTLNVGWKPGLHGQPCSVVLR